MNEKPAKYIARLNTKQRFSPEFLSFLHRRTEPFLDRVGLDRPISLLLQEAYLQGIKDAVEVMAK
jgi:hypothetical protein